MKFKTAWKLAKHVSEEVFLESQLEAAGSQRARIIDRYAQNMGDARRASNTVKFITAFMLGYLAFMPAMALSQLKDIPVTPATAPTILFVASISLAIYQGMALFFTLFLKLMTMTSFTTGSAFKFLGLLPLSRREIASIASATNLRIEHHGERRVHHHDARHRFADQRVVGVFPREHRHVRPGDPLRQQPDRHLEQRARSDHGKGWDGFPRRHLRPRPRLGRVHGRILAGLHAL